MRVASLNCRQHIIIRRANTLHTNTRTLHTLIHAHAQTARAYFMKEK